MSIPRTAAEWEQQKKLIYFAALFDTAGTIGMRLVHGLDCPYIQIRSKHRQLIEQVTEMFGGNVNDMPKQKSYHNQMYQWVQTHLGAQFVIQQLAPYIRNKKEIVQDCLAWQTRARGKRNLVRGKIRRINLLDIPINIGQQEYQ